MAAKIRLKKVGRTGNRLYRIVIADESAKRDGKVIASIGYYNPKTKPAIVKIDKQALDYWCSKGAQPTETVRKLFNL